jgi:hypothetical protein
MTSNFPTSVDDLDDPISGDPLSLSNGKASTAFVTDANDAIEATQQTVLERTSGGVRSVESFAPQTGAMLIDCETATGWASVGPAASFVATNMTQIPATGVDPTQGTFYILGTQSCTTATIGGSMLYFNFGSPVTVGGHAFVNMDIRYNQYSGGPTYLAALFEAVVASGPALTGTLQTVLLFSNARDTWVTVHVPTEGITTIGSIGIRNAFIGSDPNAAIPSGTRQTYYLDNIRFPDQSQLESAFAGSDEMAILVPPDYPAETSPNIYNVNKTLLDLRPTTALHARHAGVRHTREWGIDETGTDDVTTKLNTALASLQRGEKLEFAPDGQYLVSATLVMGLNGVEIDGQGATIFSTDWRTTSYITAYGVGGTLRNLNVTGSRPIYLYNGSNLINFVGTPTVSGTTKLLDAQNEAVMWPQVDSQAGDFFGRDKDGFNQWDVTLSDTAHVANDCGFVLYDNDTFEILYTQNLTLTSTPTVYPIKVNPTKFMHRKLLAVIKKNTATTNTITVTSLGAYNRLLYEGNVENCHGLAMGNIWSCLIENCKFEGAGGDGVICNDPLSHDVTLRNVTSRCAGRQGMSFNNTGSGVVLEDSLICESARSGIDIEPYAPTWNVYGLTVRRTEIWNSGNYSIADTHGSQSFDVHLDDVHCHNSSLGFILDGTRSRITNLSYDTTWTNSGLSAVKIYGTDVYAENIQSNSVLDLKGTGTLNGYHVTTPDNGAAITAETGWVINGVSLNNASTAPFVVQTSGVTTVGPLRIDGVHSAVEPGYFRRRFPNSFKGLLSSPIQMAGGFNVLDDPMNRVRSLSGGATNGNNLRGLGLAVTAGATTLAVAFPTRTLPTITSVGPGAIAGGTLPAARHWIKWAARGLNGGPGAPSGDFFADTAANGSIQIAFSGWVHDLDQLTYGLTLYRGLASNQYTTRYDYMPWAPPLCTLALASGKLTFVDTGAALNVTLPAGSRGYPSTVAPTAISPAAAAVDESGFEPDTSYGVWVIPSWPTTVAITAKRRGGFDVGFGVACPVGGGTIDWFICR